jgi:cytochrome P450 family 4
MSYVWATVAGIVSRPVGKVDLQFVPSLTTVLLSVVAGVVFTTVTLAYRRRRRVVRLIERIPGPPSLPLIGNCIELNVEHDGECVN